MQRQNSFLYSSDLSAPLFTRFNVEDLEPIHLDPI